MAEHGAGSVAVDHFHAGVHRSAHGADFTGHNDEGLAAETGSEAQFDELDLTGLGGSIGSDDAGGGGAGFNAAESVDAGPVAVNAPKFAIIRLWKWQEMLWNLTRF